MRTPTPEIRQAFYKRLLCSLPIGPIGEGDIAWPNSKFVPRPNKFYLSPFCMYATTAIASMSSTGFERLSGIFQVSVYGVLDTGEGELDKIASELTELFRGGTYIPLEEWNAITILRSYRSDLRIETGGEVSRPVVTVSSEWYQYTQKG